ncbi:MAG: hypothetical protein GY913_13910 [Proteobacteria bacterium]|nr:hypothetical protein [Pseudomonadota bacterium]MCP4918003.1 hypothetical protein [Pseudomonadota bacterium]
MSGFAHGRVCVVGEHGDWAGGPDAACLVAPLSAGVLATVRRADWGLVIHSAFGVTRLGDDLRCLTGDPNRYVVAVARTLLADGHPLPPGRVVVRSDLPAGRGFSSSAAVSVATARALARHGRFELSWEAAADVAYRAERDDLGVNCGAMDPLACAAPGPLFIDWTTGERRAVQGSAPMLVAAFPELVSAAPILAALGDDVPRDAIAAWGRGARRATEALEAGDLVALGRELDQAQEIYEALPHPALAAPGLSAACQTVREAGALGAKFSGAGGDRSLVAVFADEADRVAGRAALEGLGLLALDVA